MKNQNIDHYLDSLASRSSTPGGGAVAALSGAQAAALISMVCNLTRAKNDPLKKQISEINTRAESARQQFIALCDADVEGFNKVMTAYKLPKTTVDEKKYQSSELQLALKAAALPPLETLVLASQLSEDIKQLSQIGNANLITDVGIAAILVPATIQAAEMNVLINLKSLTDPEFAQETLDKIQQAKIRANELNQLAVEITASLSANG